MKMIWTKYFLRRKLSKLQIEYEESKLRYQLASYDWCDRQPTPPYAYLKYKNAKEKCRILQTKIDKIKKKLGID